MPARCRLPRPSPSATRTWTSSRTSARSTCTSAAASTVAATTTAAISAFWAWTRTARSGTRSRSAARMVPMRPARPAPAGGLARRSRPPKGPTGSRGCCTPTARCASMARASSPPCAARAWSLSNKRPSRPATRTRWPWPERIWRAPAPPAFPLTPALDLSTCEPDENTQPPRPPAPRRGRPAQRGPGQRCQCPGAATRWRGARRPAFPLLYRWPRVQPSLSAAPPPGLSGRDPRHRRGADRPVAANAAHRLFVRRAARRGGCGRCPAPVQPVSRFLPGRRAERPAAVGAGRMMARRSSLTDRGQPPAKATALYARASATFDAKLAQTQALLRQAAALGADAVTQASSLGAEDVVITHLINALQLDIPIFVLETGALHTETLALLERTQAGSRAPVTPYRPEIGAVMHFIRSHGQDAMYRSMALRKSCCGIRKLEPLARALAGKSAWITGLRREQ